MTTRLITNISRCKILNTSTKILVAPVLNRAEIGRTKFELCLIDNVDIGLLHMIKEGTVINIFLLPY
jgi:hypothetical protein